MSYSFEPVTLPKVDADGTGAIPLEPRGVPDVAVEAKPVVLPDLPPAGARTGAGAPPSIAPVSDFDRILEAARSEAHRQGVTHGQRAEAERVRTAIEAVRSAVDALGGSDVRREKEATERIVVLATAIASHLVEREVRASPDVVSDLVRRAVAEFPVNEALAVHLNPSDLALLSSGLSGDSAREHLTSGQSVRWVPDPAIRSGGCLVEGGERIVDARLSRILDRIVAALVDV